MQKIKYRLPKFRKLFFCQNFTLPLKSLPKFLNKLLGIQLAKDYTEIIKKLNILCQ